MSRTGTSELFSEEPSRAAEAAILFAAGHAPAAMDVLRAEIEEHGAACGQPTWAMLLDIFRASGKLIAFQSLAARYAREFGCAVPEWRQLQPAAQGPRMLRLDGVLASRADIGALIAQTRVRNIVPVDMGGVTRIDFAFAAELCALIHEYGIQGKRVILTNVSDLNAELLEAVAAPRRITLLRKETAALAAVQLVLRVRDAA